MKIERRGFLAGLAATAFAGKGRADAAALKPDLTLGVLSDVHLTTPGSESTLIRAFEYFRDNGADAVLIAGDIADRGRVAQLVLCGDAWRKVFPDNRAPDGRPVEKLFICGNHDAIRKDDKPSDYITHDCAAAWEKAFGEKYEDVWLKKVRGFTFIGAHWWAESRFPKFLKEHADEIDRTKPFFYTQHKHPKDTCIGAWAWGHDGGASTKALSEFPNAVAFTGHSHYSLTDERSVWQGAFTSINTATLRHFCRDYSLRENACRNDDYGYDEPRKSAMEPIWNGTGRQGMLVRVFGSVLDIERRDFDLSKPLGDNWRLTVPGGADATFAARKAKRSAPEFAAGAAVAVKDAGATVTVSFPPAGTVAKCRVFEYEVTATLFEDDVDLVLAQRRVMAPDFYRPESPEGAPGSCVFNRSELSWPGHYVFSVRPIECFGKKGAAISSDTIVLAKVGAK